MSSQGAAGQALQDSQLVFDFLPHLPVVVQRQPPGGQMSSDAGLLPLRQVDQRWRYTARMVQCLDDPTPNREQSLLSMLRQRIYGIIAGYEDCNDHDTLREDPIFKLIADGRLPDGKPLASQPTLSRFENLATPAVLQRLIDFHIQMGIERLKQMHGGRLPAFLTIDIDPTDDPVHGQQQLSLFHGYFGQHQYFPLIISEPTTRHVFVAWLRPGAVHAALGADDDLMRVVSALRKERPDILIHVRGDAGLGVPWMYKICEENGLFYTFGFTTNPRLKRLTEPLMQRAVDYHQHSGGRKARLFQCFEYQADSWDHTRIVIAKAECHSQGTNLRFVITNLPDVSASPQDWPSDPIARSIYDDYIQRGESEQRMDELKNGLCMDRLSCHRFMGNFFRLLQHVAAYNLLAAARDDKRLPPVLVSGQPRTWHTAVIKVAALVLQSTRRILVQLAGGWPNWPLYHAAGTSALSFGCGP